MRRGRLITFPAAALVLLAVVRAVAQQYRATWSDVPAATSYELHVRQPPTPWGTPSPILTPFPTRVGGAPAWSTVLDLPPGAYEIAVSARNASNTSGRSNILALSVPTPTRTATVTATSTATATLTATPSATTTQTPLDTPELYDLSGNGSVSAYDAALALRRGDQTLARCVLNLAVELACETVVAARPAVEG